MQFQNHSEFLSTFNNPFSTITDETNDAYDFVDNLDTAEKNDTHYDWKDGRFFTKVRDQGNCSSGWAISVVGIYFGKLSFSIITISNSGIS